jgi:hypothetical protein
MEPTETETTIELNFAVLSLKHTVKRTAKKIGQNTVSPD